jgi:AraC-like DNA-binding protein
MPAATTLLDAPDLYAGELVCPPDDDSWGDDALVTRPILSLPRCPAWVVRRRAGRHVVNPNHAVVHQAGDVYRRERFEGREYRCLFLYPHPALLREVAAEFDGNAGEDPSYRLPTGLVPIDQSAYSLSRRVAHHLGATAHPDVLRSTEALYRVLRVVVGAALRARTSPGRPARAERSRSEHADIAEHAKATLTARFAERLTVGAVAADVHVSPYHLTRVFRAQTGFALHEYLNQLRVRSAFERIRDGNDDLATLAADVGFSSHSHLTANFRRAFGGPPTVATRWRGPSPTESVA